MDVLNVLLNVVIWGLRLSMLGLCLYGVLSRKKHFIRFGLSGLGGSTFGWGITRMILVDFTTGFLAVLFGLALVWFVNPGMLTLLRRRRHRVRIDLEFKLTPATKIEKSVLPKKGEKEEEYKNRMR